MCLLKMSCTGTEYNIKHVDEIIWEVQSVAKVVYGSRVLSEVTSIHSSRLVVCNRCCQLCVRLGVTMFRMKIFAIVAYACVIRPCVRDVHTFI